MDPVEKIKTFDIEILRPIDLEDEKWINDLQEKYKIQLPNDYIRLMKTIGHFQFSFLLKAKGIERVPLISNNFVPVADFLTWREGKRSIQGKLEKFSEQFSEGFIPFANGLLHDLIGFWYRSETEYKIGYWSHGGLPRFGTYHVADSFEDFTDTLIFGE
jgi:hypothetical protein